MEKTEILEKIKEAELKVEKDVNSAEEEKKNKIIEAKLKAREIIEKAKADIEKEKEEIKKVRQKEIDAFEEKGKGNLMKAVDMLYKEFVGMVEHV